MWFSTLSGKLRGTGYPWPLTGTLRSQLLVLSRRWGPRSPRKPAFCFPSSLPHSQADAPGAHAHPEGRTRDTQWAGLGLRPEPLLARCGCSRPSWGVWGQGKPEGLALALGGPHHVPWAALPRLACGMSGSVVTWAEGTVAAPREERGFGPTPHPGRAPSTRGAPPPTMRAPPLGVACVCLPREGCGEGRGRPAQGPLACEVPRSLTALSIPRVSSMMKKMTAQAEDSGSVASASG